MVWKTLGDEVRSREERMAAQEEHRLSSARVQADLNIGVIRLPNVLHLAANIRLELRYDGGKGERVEGDAHGRLMRMMEAFGMMEVRG